MSRFIGFLRAVNVGSRQYPMARLRETLEAAGFTDVETHIQTGNVLVVTPLRSPARVVDVLEHAMREDIGFEVPVVVFTPRELAAVSEDCDDLVRELGAPEFGHYVELLAAEPDDEARELIESQQKPGQRVVCRGRAMHLLLDIPYHQAKAPSAAVKRALGVSTNRNATVIRALARKWT